MSLPVHERLSQIAALFLGFALVPAAAQAQIAFESHQVGQSPQAMDIVAHADFNYDGREDLMVLNSGTTSNGLVYLSSGDGTYQAPVTLPQTVFPNGVAVGDFNQDGKLDFAASGPSGSQLSIYLGNGDGTFQARKIVADSTASGENIQGLAAADLSHDGKTDLVEIVGNKALGGNSLQVWISNGNGTFTTGQRSSGSQIIGGFGTFAGDFDGDGKADVATIYADKGPVTVQVWYGDGAGHLGSPLTRTDPNNYDSLSMQVADINNDGRSDLVTGGSFTYHPSNTSEFYKKIAVFSGNANRTLSYSNIATGQCAGGVAVADFNGDGINDLAYSQTACTGSSTSDFVIRPGAGKGSFGAAQTVYQSTYTVYQPYAVRTTTETKPDLVFTKDLGSRNDPSTNPPEALVLLSNVSHGFFPGCGVTGIAEGIRICAPAATANTPVTFSIGAAGPTAMRTAAVWVDGKKVHEQLTHAFSNYSFLDASIPLAVGNHSITIFGTGWDSALQKTSFPLSVSAATCSAPTSPGVHVCSPANGSTVSTPVEVKATATITGTLARMELWVDGGKKYTETSSRVLDTSITLGVGSHRFTVIAANTAGTKWQSVVNATVK
jgi:hypothetical protein